MTWMPETNERKDFHKDNRKVVNRRGETKR